MHKTCMSFFCAPSDLFYSSKHGFIIFDLQVICNVEIAIY